MSDDTIDPIEGVEIPRGKLQDMNPWGALIALGQDLIEASSVRDRETTGRVVTAIDVAFRRVGAEDRRRDGIPV